MQFNVSSSASNSRSADVPSRSTRPPLSSPSGLLIIHKPEGPTSFHVLQRVKRFLEAAHAGHCGTLDPAASGVLLVLLGQATRRQESLMKYDKTYAGSFLLGQETDSGDLQGKTIRQMETTPFSLEALRETACRMTGSVLQVPPMYSAVKVGGRPLYRWARQGITIPRAARPVTISRFEITEYAHPAVHFKMECSSGTYVRVLAEEFGRWLGCGAVLASLVREKVGPYGLDESLSLDEIQEKGKEWTLGRVIPL
jgi:tRNA pseudouridine55 synthase